VSELSHAARITVAVPDSRSDSSHNMTLTAVNKSTNEPELNNNYFKRIKTMQFFNLQAAMQK
jgi:hypothetical protein